MTIRDKFVGKTFSNDLDRIIAGRDAPGFVGSEVVILNGQPATVRLPNGQVRQFVLRDLGRTNKADLYTIDLIRGAVGDSSGEHYFGKSTTIRLGVLYTVRDDKASQIEIERVVRNGYEANE